MSEAARRRGAEEARKRHREAWLFALAIGSAVIAIGNGLGLSPWLIALLVSGVMLLFALVVHGTEVSADSKGDSLYYLGLLFTFVALVAALVAFDWESGTAETAAIIRNFGVALLTTIVGLAGRVWYAMSQDGPGDLEEALRSDLEDAVREMKGSLDRARNELDIMVLKFTESAREMTESGREMARATISVSGTADRAEEAGRTLESLVERVTGSFKSIADRLSELDRAVDGGSEAAQRLSRNVTSLSRPATALARDLAEASEGVRNFHNTLNAARRTTEPVAKAILEATDGVVAAAAHAGRLGGRIAELDGNAREAGDAVGRVAAQARATAGDVESTRRKADRLGRRMRKLTGHAESVEAEFTDARESAHAARKGIDGVVEGARALEEQISNRQDALAESMESVGERANGLDSGLSDLGKRSGRLAGAVDVATLRAERLAGQLQRVRAGDGGWGKRASRWMRRRFSLRGNDDASEPGNGR